MLAAEAHLLVMYWRWRPAFCEGAKSCCVSSACGLPHGLCHLLQGDKGAFSAWCAGVQENTLGKQLLTVAQEWWVPAKKSLISWHHALPKKLTALSATAAMRWVRPCKWYQPLNVSKTETWTDKGLPKRMPQSPTPPTSGMLKEQ